MYADGLVYSRRKFVAVFTGKYFGVDDLTKFTMRNSQGCITDFSFFLAKNGTEESFLRSQFGFSLRSYFSDQNITRTNISTDHDDAAFVEVFESVFRNTEQLSGNFFCSKLGVTCLAFVFLDVDGGVKIILTRAFGDRTASSWLYPSQDKPNERVFTKGKFAPVCRHTVSQYGTDFNTVTLKYYRTLVEAVGLVGTHEFNEMVNIFCSVIIVQRGQSS